LWGWWRARLTNEALAQGCGPACSRHAKEAKRGVKDPCAACPLTQSEIHPLTRVGVDVHAMLTGGPLGEERYRLTRIELTQEQADFVFIMADECERVMQERERARAEDARRNAARS
jgi:hypothetical protein